MLRISSKTMKRATSAEVLAGTNTTKFITPADLKAYTDVEVPLTLTAASVGFTIAGGTTSKTLTVALNANVAGTNTGDITLATNHGLGLSNQVLNMGTPSTVTTSSANGVTTTTHNHALTLAISDYQFIPVEAGLDGASAPGAAEIYTSTNKIVARDFRGGTGNQDLFFIWNPPDDITGATITYRVHYLITSSTVPANTETVIFSMTSVAVGSLTGGYSVDSLISHALGSAIAVTDTYATATLPAQYALIHSAWSAAVTPTHLATGKTVIINLLRDQATDTYAQEVGLVGFDIKFTRTLAA